MDRLSTVAHLSAGYMALNDISSVAADHSTACENILINIPALQNIFVDTRNLLEYNDAALHGTECTLDGSDTVKTGKLD